MNILGIGGVLSDSAAALIQDGTLAAAIEEIKLTRKSQPGRLPEQAMETCLGMASLKPENVDYIALARPLPPGPEVALALRRFINAKIVSVDHHAAHAASAYFASPFEDATVITLDRQGDLRCGSTWFGEGNRLWLQNEILYPNSIGELYGQVTERLGFQARADEHRVQWLSTSGEPKYDLAPGGDLSLPGAKPADIAASMQQSLSEYVLRLAGSARNVCMAGGVAWNALLVSTLEANFEGVFAQPAAGNAGTALGAALSVWHETLGKTKRIGANYSLGPAFAAAEIKQVLENCKLRFHLLSTVPEQLNETVRLLKDNRIVAWMQGRMEFGPRALGNRSILASPDDPYSAENLNTFIKHRESTRKFAASVPAELASEYFEVGTNARHLATVSKVRPQYKERFQSALLSQDQIRVHTVEKGDNELYWQLLHQFGKSNGMPVLYNTSFNLFGEPLVCTPRDAVRSFYSSGIDAMVAGNFLLEK